MRSRHALPAVSIPLLVLLAATPVAGLAADKERKPGPAASPGAGQKHGPEGAAVARNADGEPARFRVDMHMEKDGQHVVMRRFVDGPRSRMEAEVEGRKVVIIDLGDAKGTTYTLLPSEKRAIKSSMAVVNETSARVPGGGAAGAEAAPEEPEGELERIGDDAVDGKPAEKYRVTTPQGTGLLWIETATQLPLRMEADGMKVEMKNYDFSPQAAELFEVPKKFDLLDMDEVMKSLGPGGDKMMKGMGGGMRGMAAGLGGEMGAGLGGQVGAGLGASVGGPVGSMIGRYLGQRIGQSIGQRAGKAVSPR